MILDHARLVYIVNVERGAKTLQSLTSEISLRLNMSKAEIVHLSRHPLPSESINIMDTRVDTKTEAKCLGVWWCQGLSSRKSVEENIMKSRRAFFCSRCYRCLPGYM